jgi:DNA-binding MarR family transcriptional regulator
MNKSVFNPEDQQRNLSSKIIAGLERISEVFKVLLWEKAKLVGLSPIQIQLLIFIAYHKQELRTVSHLAKEFNITKPTISDAIKVLTKKDLIKKDHSSSDNRSYSISLSTSGEEFVSEIQDFTSPLETQINNLKETDLEGLFETLSALIFKLNQNGILTVQRTCYGCSFFEKNETSNFCKLLEKELTTNDIRLDCPEFIEKV